MAKRGAKRSRLKAPSADYVDGEGNVLTLRGSLTPATRVRYARTLAGQAGSAASTLDDSQQRATELLFEHLAARWVIAGVPLERQRELLARFRIASPAERAWVRETLRTHCAQSFPDVEVP